MARQAKAEVEGAEADTGPVTETITYIPGQGDPVTVKWAGQTFHANVPKELTGDASGSETAQLNHHIITTARNGHPHFVAGGGDAKPRASRKAPKTAEEYRAHVAKWLQDPDIDTPEKLIGKFAKEREMQAACEVGTTDYELIGQLLMPRLGDLAKHSDMTEQQVAQAWLRAGITQLPWDHGYNNQAFR